MKEQNNEQLLKDVTKIRLTNDIKLLNDVYDSICLLLSYTSNQDERMKILSTSFICENLLDKKYEELNSL